MDLSNCSGCTTNTFSQFGYGCVPCEHPRTVNGDRSTCTTWCVASPKTIGSQNLVNDGVSAPKRPVCLQCTRFWAGRHFLVRSSSPASYPMHYTVYQSLSSRVQGLGCRVWQSRPSWTRRAARVRLDLRIVLVHELLADRGLPRLCGAQCGRSLAPDVHCVSRRRGAQPEQNRGKFKTEASAVAAQIDSNAEPPGLCSA